MAYAPAEPHDVTLLTTPESLAAAAKDHARASGPIAVDLESDGLFADRAKVCIVQLAARGRVFVVDALATPLQPLAPLLADERVEKIVHDVSFDARILAESGVSLANVRDTSIAARMLGRTATGLASLLASELGVVIDKKLQQHDWSERPLDARALEYLAGDVVHLDALAGALFAAVEERGIAAEVEEETRYRLRSAEASAGASDPRPPYVRLKHVDRAPEEDLKVLRRIAEVREAKARALDVPPYKVLAPDVLFAIAKARPRTIAELEAIRGATGGRRARSLAGEILEAVRAAKDDELPAAERAMLARPRVAASVARARRAREQRLTRWRKAEAKRRGVDEQVVLPGHCLQDLADVLEPSLGAIAAVPGIGAFRAARDGEAILAALADPQEDEAAAPAAEGAAATAAARDADRAPDAGDEVVHGEPAGEVPR
jgi:ribonuclease D